MIDPYALLLCSLAVYRLARLVALDGITETPREWLVLHSPGKLADLWECPFCVSVWCMFAVLPAWVLGPDWMRWGITGAAVAGLAVLPYELTSD